MHHRMHAVTTALICALAPGCVSQQFTLPKGFVRVQDYVYEVKGVSAKGHAIGLRIHENTDPPGDLDFWTQAVEHQKVDIDGMKLAAREAIRSDAGLDGTLFQFELGEGPGKTGYWVALWVSGRRILTVEAALPAEIAAEEAEAIRKSMRSVR
ncbi:MAG: hypothetical protein IT449_01665 [Phycisphaerales bacterium]|nr:hypothetical protein [Phycisphaerales bacterium]